MGRTKHRNAAGAGNARKRHNKARKHRYHNDSSVSGRTFCCLTYCFSNRMMSNLFTKDKVGALFEFDYNLMFFRIGHDYNDL